MGFHAPNLPSHAAVSNFRILQVNELVRSNFDIVLVCMCIPFTKLFGIFQSMNILSSTREWNHLLIINVVRVDFYEINQLK